MANEGFILTGSRLLPVVAVIAVAIPASAAVAQPQVGSCGAVICINSGDANWQIDVSDYCDSEVCLRDTLASLSDLNWDEVLEGREQLTISAQNPYVGLTDEQYARLAELGDDDIDEQVQLLSQVSTACRSTEFTLELDVPGRDIVKILFATSASSVGGPQQFQVVEIDRTYRSLPGGSMGWWIRWISHRFPGIVRIDDVPRDFASYETGLYVSRLVLLDTQFQPGQPADYGDHPDCIA